MFPLILLQAKAVSFVDNTLQTRSNLVFPLILLQAKAVSINDVRDKINDEVSVSINSPSGEGGEETDKFC